MKITIKQHAILKKKKKKDKKNWSNITIGSLTLLKELQRKKKTLFYTKKTRLLNKKNGINLFVENIPDLDNINEIIFKNKKYKNKWINKITNIKQISFKSLFFPKKVILHSNQNRNLLIRLLINYNNSRNSL